MQRAAGYHAAVIDSIHQALTKAFPEKAVGLPGGVHVYTMSGRDAASGRAWSYIDAHTGSEGGRTRNDGLDAQPYPLFGVDGWGISLEALEVKIPSCSSATVSGRTPEDRGGCAAARE